MVLLWFWGFVLCVCWLCLYVYCGLSFGFVADVCDLGFGTCGLGHVGFSCSCIVGCDSGSLAAFRLLVGVGWYMVSVLLLWLCWLC